jgi:hypothetical protein
MIRERTRVFVLSLVAVLVWSTVAPAGGTATAGPPSSPRHPGAARPATVTLVTGDVVTLGGPRGVAVRAAAGREHLGFRSHTDLDGHVHVLPEDVVG